MTRISDIRALPESWERPETPGEVIKRKYPLDLIQLTKNRMIMGYMRYGAHRASWKEQIINDPLPVSLRRLLSKLIQFIWTRNLEFLVDVVVYSFLIWRFGTGNRLHFSAVERHEVEALKENADALANELLWHIEEKFRSEYYEGQHDDRG